MSSLSAITYGVAPSVEPDFTPAPASARQRRAVLIGITGAIVCQIILLTIALWHTWQLINFDGVVYIRIASYYAQRRFDLAVSGYFGPLLSWLMTPFLGLVAQPQDAARIAMGLSAVIFLLGCVCVLRSLQVHPAGVVLGTWIAAVASTNWSVVRISPDLLLGGIMALAISQMVSPRWIESRRTQLLAGILWGAAYLTKSVAFPLAFGISIGIAAL